MPRRRAIAAGPSVSSRRSRDLDSIDRRLATLIDATHLCGIDPLQLAFTKLHRVNPQAYLTDVLTKLVNN